MLAAALALITSLCYGASNYVGPALSRDLPTYPVLIAGQAIAFVASASVLVVTAAALPDAGVLAAAAGAGIGNAWGLIAFYRAASLGPLSIVTPVGSLAVVVPVTAGVASGEPLGVVKLAGCLLALGGVALAARRSVGGPTRDTRAAIRWALISALGFGAFLALVAPASHDGVFWAVAASRVVLLALMVAAAFFLAAPLRAPLRRLPVIAVPGLLLFGGTLAYSAATREGDLSVVAVCSSLFPVVTVGLAYLGGERVSRLQAIGIAAALAGIVLVSAGGT
jgi:drug/metabolite transporter (DMT)-like permease